MHAPRNTIKHTHAEISLSAADCQVSRGDTNGGVVGHKSKLQ